MTDKTLAERLHDGEYARAEIEEELCELYENHEPEVYGKGLDFEIGSDDYDNSLEVYFKTKLEYPYEPCQKIREGLLALGFAKIYWNFEDGDEVRAWEPRHIKRGPWISHKYGYVDSRFNQPEWELKYMRKP